MSKRPRDLTSKKPPSKQFRVLFEVGTGSTIRSYLPAEDFHREGSCLLNAFYFVRSMLRTLMGNLAESVIIRDAVINTFPGDCNVAYEQTHPVGQNLLHIRRCGAQFHSITTGAVFLYSCMLNLCVGARGKVPLYIPRRVFDWSEGFDDIQRMLDICQEFLEHMFGTQILEYMWGNAGLNRDGSSLIVFMSRLDPGFQYHPAWRPGTRLTQDADMYAALPELRRPVLPFAKRNQLLRRMLCLMRRMHGACAALVASPTDRWSLACFAFKRLARELLRAFFPHAPPRDRTNPPHAEVFLPANEEDPEDDTVIFL